MKKESILLEKIKRYCILTAVDNEIRAITPLEVSIEILIYPYTSKNISGTVQEEKFYDLMGQYPELIKELRRYIDEEYRGVILKKLQKRSLIEKLKKGDDPIILDDYIEEGIIEINNLLSNSEDTQIDVVSYFLAWYEFDQAKDIFLSGRLSEVGLTFEKIFNYCKMDNNNLELKEKTFELESEAGDVVKELPQNSWFDMPMEEEEAIEESSTDTNATPNLNKYAFDMTKAASEGKFDPVVGRSVELEELLKILCCRKKNNALLLGEPGVGKTAIVEALAQKIANNDVPKYLFGKKIMSLNLNNLVAGTKYRGQFEERLKKIIEEVTSHPEIIIFIDEFHTIIGSGASEGGGDAANILKPYLARGEFQCIGSTTEEEYRKHVEKDGALKRRFQNVRIYAPTLDEVNQILLNIKDKYEDYHGVSYSPEIIQSIVSLTNRYVLDRNFPDKAIDLMDLSGSITKLNNSNDEELKQKIKELEDRILELKNKKNESVAKQNFEAASEYRDQERIEQEKLDTLRGSISGSDCTERFEVTELNVIKAISRISGVPLEKIGTSDLVKLKTMKETLEKIVIGQSEAIMEVTKALQRNSLGLRDPKRPIASLLMVGPTGSGKTYICKTLAKEFFGSEEALIKFDMSEYGEKHEITKLIGASASYVGYGDTPLLEQIRKRPYSVVLFDEIEKADKAIYQLFLSILDEGIVTLANGVKVDFKNCVIVFTGNVGTKDLILKGSGMGFVSEESSEEKKKKIDGIVKKAIEKQFAPEFINRLTKTVIFNELSKENLLAICDLEMKKLIDRLAESDYKLTVDKTVKELIVSKCDLKYGARDLQRNIIRYIEDEICNELLNISDVTKKKIRVSLDKKDSESVEVKFS